VARKSKNPQRLNSRATGKNGRHIPVTLSPLPRPSRSGRGAAASPRLASPLGLLERNVGCDDVTGVVRSVGYRLLLLQQDEVGGEGDGDGDKRRVSRHTGALLAPRSAPCPTPPILHPAGEGEGGEGPRASIIGDSRPHRLAQRRRRLRHHLPRRFCLRCTRTRIVTDATIKRAERGPCGGTTSIGLSPGTSERRSIPGPGAHVGTPNGKGERGERMVWQQQERAKPDGVGCEALARDGELALLATETTASNGSGT
jgi:hypothetical protein